MLLIGLSTVSSLNMPAAKHLTVLVSLLTVTVCGGATISPTTEQGKEINTNAAHFSNFTSLSTVHYTSSALKSQTATQVTTEVTSTSPQTPRTEETNPGTSPVTTPITHTSTEKVSQGQTVPSASPSGSTNVSTTVNTTSPVLSTNWVKGELASNPGLVAILCIFCIVFGLVLVVVTVKCIKSPRSNFERLEEMPLGKVNEESPFAQYSK